jgi:ZIP family zinc transporter
MSPIWNALAYALLPFIGNAIGATLAESVRTPRWVTGAALHAAAGIAIALVSVELMPRVLGELPLHVIVLGFLVGALLSVAIAYAIAMLHASERASGHASGWTIFAVVLIDLMSDGLITGAGTAIGTAFGFLVAASQTVANIPGGFAVAARLREAGVGPSTRLLVLALPIVPVMASTVAGVWLLAGTDRAIQDFTLMVIAGVLLLATVEDVIPQGDAPGTKRWISSAAFALGFAGFVLLARSVA